MLNFIIGCIGLAVCLSVGMFFCNLIIYVVFFAFALIGMASNAIWNFLTGRE